MCRKDFYCIFMAHTQQQHQKQQHQLPPAATAATWHFWSASAA